ncbi:MAG: large conductance mechanosensitive channel protein MscL [Candidatus Faecivicinus sp.]
MSKLVKEFKEFAFKGNVVDMAVGVMIGSAFGGIVTSIVNDLVTPVIAVLTGSVNFSSLVIKLGEGEEAPFIAIGNFIQTVINFFIIAVCIFAMVKFINTLKRPAPEAPKKEARKCPYCKSEIADDATRCPHCTSQLN